MENAIENKIVVSENKLALYIVAVIDIAGLAFLIVKSTGILAA